MVKEICEVVEGPVSAEVASIDFDAMLAEGKYLSTLAPNIAVKVPLTPAGLKVCRILSRDGTMVNVTLCFSAAQAILAAKAGATFVSGSFVGRLDDVGQNGMDLIAEIAQIFAMYDNFDTQILVASVRSPMHVVEAAKMGADVATIPSNILRQLFNHPLTDKGLAQFVADWKKTGQTIPRLEPERKSVVLVKPSEGAPAPPRKASPAVPAADPETEASIAAYLKAHPDFIQRNPKILQALMPASADRGKSVVDFQRYMVTRLQGDVEKLGVEKIGLIHTARANAQNQSRIHDAILALIDARSLGQMIEVLTGDLAVMLNVDAVAMVVESSGNDLPYVASSGIRIVENGAVAKWLGRKDVLLRGGVAGEPAIYGPAAGLIASEALLRLSVSKNTPVGLLAFGSRDPTMFKDGQGTEMIGFLGSVVERLIRTWLDLPPA